MVIVILQWLLLHKSLQQGHGASISVHFGALFSVPAPTVSLWCMTKRGHTSFLKAGLDVESPAQQLTVRLQSTSVYITENLQLEGVQRQASVAQINLVSQIADIATPIS